MNIILIGASGATGRDLLDLLLLDPQIKQITILARRDLACKHEKLNVHKVNFQSPEEWKELVQGDVLFSCLGTTLKDAGSKKAQWLVDYQYQYNVTKAAKENQVKCIALVSAEYANAKSVVFYSKMKGQLEEDIKKLDFQKLIIFQPPMLVRKNSTRLMERLINPLIKAFNAIGLFLALKPLPTNLLAEAMIKAVKISPPGNYTFKGQEIIKWLGITKQKPG